MKLFKLTPLFLIVALPLVWQACNDTPLEQRDNFNRTEMLTAITNTVILPVHEAMVPQATLLVSATEAFNNNPTQTTLDALQAEWLQTKLAWKQCELFDLGPVMDQVLHNRIDKWQTNPAFIENFIVTEDTINERFIDGIGSTSKGLPAMEYLLFSNGDAVVLDSFTVGSLPAKRKAYLLALAQNIKVSSEVLLNVWAATGEHYAQDFIDGTGDGLEGSINMLSNEMVSQTEKLMRKNIGNPLGTESGQGIDPSLVEAPYALVSFELLTANLVSLQTTFNGGTNSTDIGLDDYLDYLSAEYEGIPLSDKINSQFDLIFDKIDAINEPLESAVSNQTAQVQEVYDALRDLLVLIKVDMANNLAVTITFSDNDGD